MTDDDQNKEEEGSDTSKVPPTKVAALHKTKTSTIKTTKTKAKVGDADTKSTYTEHNSDP
eukprot:CAMPEP_0172500502 /NCGR_PEP_ID=MMETSP1066-20121228/139285_1 /TAXON_ID=671091 /ORGANISM="Coscinodiscus wailesii, Strain CCMP2513" /LENGTH=59 /DNA_ID=CAMNT_0013274773 /DNA_START=86 /DNA_END=261 /DNA_ORIENTATION=+